jgi:4-hydroxy-2-oxoheptanedioate aldolase
MSGLRARLHDGKPFLFSWMSMAGAQLASQMARLPLDGVCLDMQHGMMGFQDAVPMTANIAAVGKTPIVRVLWNDAGLVGQVLDAGVSIVIAPMINSVAQAQALVKAAKYPPLGQRSWGGYTMLQVAKTNPGDYLKNANSETLVFAMIETREALGLVDEIAAVQGLDGLFVGPSDLSIALSHGAGINKTAPEVLLAMEQVAAACNRNGLVAGAFAGTADIMNEYRARGFNFLAAVVDVDLLRLGADAVLKGVK